MGVTEMQIKPRIRYSVLVLRWAQRHIYKNLTENRNELFGQYTHFQLCLWLQQTGNKQ